MFEISVYTNGDIELARKFQLAPELIKKETELVLQQEARTLAYELGFRTNPYGTQDPVKYKRRVEFDVRRVYASKDRQLNNDARKVFYLIKTKDEKLADIFWAQLKDGQFDRALATIRRAKIGGNVDYANYRQTRKGANRVDKAQQALSLVAESRLVALINKQVKRVGTAKAGWFQAQKAIGGRARGNKQFPQWVRKAGSKTAGDLGTSNKKLNGDRPEVVLINKVKYLQYALYDIHIIRALYKAEERFSKELQKRWQGVKRKKGL